MGKTAGENPPLPIAMRFIEPGNVVYDSHPPHLGPDRLQHAGSEIVLIAEGAEIRNKLVFGVFQVDEYGQKDFLLVPASRKKQGRKFIQIFDSGNLVAAELNLCPRHAFLPYPFRPKQGIRRGYQFLGDVKIF